MDKTFNFLDTSISSHEKIIRIILFFYRTLAYCHCARVREGTQNAHKTPPLLTQNNNVVTMKWKN